MSKDLLSEATRALREAEDASELEARATRARVMTGLHQARVRRRTRVAFLLPIAATFVAASAWATANGAPQRLLQSLERLIAPAPPSVAHRPPVAKAAPNSLSEPVPTPALSEPVDVPVPDLPLPLPPSASTPAAPDPTLALYRAAHSAHFVAHDPARALAAWDTYLAAAPNGQFAPEAKYNRALSLVRLGRTAEARAALEPFALGNYGGYRKSDASALLERLEQ